jgi:DNA-binding MarR family transcriptional regulator
VLQTSPCSARHYGKQTLTTMTRLLARDGLVTRKPDVDDARATRLFLTRWARDFAPIAESVLADLDRDVAKMLGKDAVAQLEQALTALVGLGQSAGRAAA